MRKAVRGWYSASRGSRIRLSHSYGVKSKRTMIFTGVTIGTTAVMGVSIFGWGSKPEDVNNNNNNQPSGETNFGTTRDGQPGTKETSLFTFRAAAAMIPHPEKAHRGGEDAYFIHPLSIGVADGVGGWAKKKVDPGIFARGLMANTNLFITHSDWSENDDIAAEALDWAHQKVNYITGSSTAIVSVLTGTGKKLNTCNVGDSRMIAIRNGKVFGRTVEQQRRFNAPFQLGGGSAWDRSDRSKKHGARYNWDVQEGDVIVMGSDGVFDNLFEDEIVYELNQSIGGSESVAATAIAKYAFQKSNETGKDSPFSAAARREGHQHSPSGKPDDITVVVATIVAVPPTSNRAVA